MAQFFVCATGLIHCSTTNEKPCCGRSYLGVELDDARRSREPLDERKEPVGPAITGETGDLGKSKRQIVGEDQMPGLHLGLEDRVVGLGSSCRSFIALRRADLQQVHSVR
jgi:hypothetical protein